MGIVKMGELGIYGLQSEVEPFGNVVETLLKVLEMTHPRLQLRAHAERVAYYTLQLGRQMGLGALERDYLHYGTLLHDIGKITLPVEVLFNTAPLSPDHREEYENHTLRGERLCLPLRSALPILPFIRSHHEKLDGSGYPDGLSAHSLSLAVQILAVANTYDTLRMRSFEDDDFAHDKTMTALYVQATRGWWNRDAVELMDACGREFK